MKQILTRIRTWWSGLARRDRRALAVCGVVLGLLVGYRRVVLPLLADLRGLREQVAMERDLLVRERQLLADRASLRKAYAEDSVALLKRAPQLFAGRDSVTASADLVSYVTGLAPASRVFVQASEPRSASGVTEGVVMLAAEFRAVSDLAGLERWLGSLERGPMLVNVAELSVSPATVIGRDVASNELLAISIVVHGYALLAPEPAGKT